MNIKITKKIKSFEGDTLFYEYDSPITKTLMKFSTFIPKSSEVDSAIIWLSGLTCTEENFITKSGVQNLLKSSSTMVICPDTSPRGLDLPGEHETYDFGSGAGFYINATTEGYKEHYQMYDYISEEIVGILREYFKITNISIMGHSMGGHGALILGLNEGDKFKSISAFSPIVNPLKSAWGQKAFKGYLGNKIEDAKKYDATELIEQGVKREDTILIDQGLDDEFLAEELLTDNLVKACKRAGQKVVVKYREGYDHSYYYISSFLEEHIHFHLKALEE
jgi:S-formylglutathione hydrolase